MTKTELDTQFQILVPEFPFSSYTASVLEWFNQAQRAVAEKNLISDKVSTPSVKDVGEYNLPDNYIEIKRGGVYFDNKQLEAKSLQGLVDLYGEAWKDTASGTPLYYLLTGGTIELVPKPDTDSLNLILDFFGYPNDLSASGDLPFTTGDITAGYDYNNRLRSLDKLLLEYAIGMAKFSLGLYANTQTALQNFYTLLNQRVAEFNRRPDLEKTTVSPSNIHLRTMARRLNSNAY